MTRKVSAVQDAGDSRRISSILLHACRRLAAWEGSGKWGSEEVNAAVRGMMAEQLCVMMVGANRADSCCCRGGPGYLICPISRASHGCRSWLCASARPTQTAGGGGQVERASFVIGTRVGRGRAGQGRTPGCERVMRAGACELSAGGRCCVCRAGHRMATCKKCVQRGICLSCDGWQQVLSSRLGLVPSWSVADRSLITATRRAVPGRASTTDKGLLSLSGSGAHLAASRRPGRN